MRAASRFRLPARDEMQRVGVEDHEILEGVPDARTLFTAHSEDDGASAGFWTCDVGRYEFLFDYDEFLYVIEGEVEVTDTRSKIAAFTMTEGDSAHFPQGITTIWHVKRKLTKYFVARAPY